MQELLTGNKRNIEVEDIYDSIMQLSKWIKISKLILLIMQVQMCLFYGRSLLEKISILHNTEI